MSHTRLLLPLFFLFLFAFSIKGHTDTKEQDDEKEHSFLFHDQPMELPLRINVALVGFSGSGSYGYNLDEIQLHRSLSVLLPKRSPAILDTKELTRVEYLFEYNVYHADAEKKDLIHVYEEAVRACLEETTSQLFVCEATHPKIQEFFNVQMHKDFLNETTIILLNPDKSRILKDKQGIYLYTYMSGAYAKNWMSERGYVVVDFTSGPTQLGKSDVGEGTIARLDFPEMDQYQAKAKAIGIELKDLDELQAHVCSLVMKTVIMVFAPDIAYENLRAADKILVPVIVFRDHHEFNPWEPGHPYSIDMPTIEREVKKILYPNSDIHFVTGLHQLSDHRHISLAVQKSIRYDTSYEMDMIGAFRVVQKPFIDSRVLMHTLKESEDNLAMGLIDDQSPLLKQYFFLNIQRPKEEKLQKPLNTRVVPIYIFSLTSLPPGITMEQSSNLHHSQNMAVILQTNSTKIRIPFFNKDAPVYMNALNVTKHIVASLLSLLGGVVDPTMHYSSIHDKTMPNYMWAVGHQPFGPFSNTHLISQHFVELSFRNPVLSRLDKAVKLAESSISLVNGFLKKNIYDPFSDDLDHNQGQNLKFWLDKLFHAFSKHDSALSPFSQASLYQLHMKLVTLEKILAEASNLVFKHKFIPASSLSVSIITSVKAFQKYAVHQIQLTEKDLMCCQLTHHVVREFDFVQLILICFVLAVVSSAVLYYFLFLKPSSAPPKFRR
eukprot:TRINITY_DN3827_c0_g1_i1.p1 TRINITY_DN3827_c0_g1~~TRINITY_DN3827_c0_g1_i1.p1  ORF type:complete len:731 (-),score=161.65 TRINITY_DN3827_c0_g1_i1:157-2310(-)